MRDTEDPDLLREIFDTDILAPSYQRSETIQKAWKLFIDTGREKDAIEARWDAALFIHHRRELALEKDGRFGPAREFSDGSMEPDPSIFTEEALDYFERRADEVNSPVLQSWYADFIWERRRNHLFARKAIEALHETYPLFFGNGGMWHQAADSVVRPLRLARALQQPHLVDAAKSMVFAALQDFMSAQVHSSVRYALDLIDALLEGRDVTEEETSVLLQDAELGEAFYKVQHTTYHLARSFGERVATLQRRLGVEGGSREAQLRIGRYYEADAHGTESSLAAATHLQAALKHYASMGNSEEVERLKKATNLLWGSEQAQNEFKTIQVEVEYPLEQVRESARVLLSLGLEEALKQLGLPRSFIPAIDLVRERSRNLTESLPLQHLVTLTTMRGSRQVHRADTPDKSEEASLYEQYDLEAGVLGGVVKLRK